MAKYVAAIDQGTTSTRCIIFDRASNIVAVAQKEHRQIYPQPGWVEHDPMEIWERTQEVVREALQKAGITGADLAAVGVTNQRETTVVWDPRTGKPYTNALVWQDTRTQDIVDELSADGGPDRFRAKVGLPISTYFSGTKLRWILENVPGVRAAAERGEAIFGTIDTWLIWWLTGGPGKGVHITDVTNASRTMLMNLETLSWDDEILNILDIPRQMLPEIRPSSDPNLYGTTDPNGPFGAAVPVCGDLGDQQAALVGQTGFDVGEVKNTYGTGCFVVFNTGTRRVPSFSGLLTSVAYQFGQDAPVFCLEGSIAITGALVQWLRDNLGLISKSSEVEDLARTVEDSGGIYFVPAFSGLFAPHWDGKARGLIIGMTRYINRGHLARAVLEATAYQTREVLDAMRKDSGVELARLKVDGGMVVNELLMQFQADVAGIPVIRPKVAETTSLGAAYAAGLAVGYWENLEELRQYWQEDKRWEPQWDEARRERAYRGWLRAVERAKGWLED
ncbi:MULTISPECIES: glycerol kinase GlpK [Limnochorda]|uniref:glycerol kinase GlpK n=1 Tax=Limnochorda TaxID=1676651 RepID=UPI001E03974E|nr:glycerol kinase GlpK [Limnochorda pilosa]MBO2487223.1 glycerol kinase [Bacillota bacterium]MBO2518521.1 glycerol kinase [Bacillota bacterium]